MDTFSIANITSDSETVYTVLKEDFSFVEDIWSGFAYREKRNHLFLALQNGST